MLKNKLLTYVALLLLLINAITITMFWIDRCKHKKPPPRQQESPAMFLTTELKLDAKQQEQFEILKEEHKEIADSVRLNIKNAKEVFFKLLQQKEATDSTKNIALKNISKATEALDLLTFNHFYKVRLLCNTTQQKKFNEIINEVVKMMANRPRPRRNRDGNSELPPPSKPEED